MGIPRGTCSRPGRTNTPLYFPKDPTDLPDPHLYPSRITSLKTVKDERSKVVSLCGGLWWTSPRPEVRRGRPVGATWGTGRDGGASGPGPQTPSLPRTRKESSDGAADLCRGKRVRAGENSPSVTRVSLPEHAVGSGLGKLNSLKSSRLGRGTPDVRQVRSPGHGDDEGWVEKAPPPPLSLLNNGGGITSESPLEVGAFVLDLLDPLYRNSSSLTPLFRLPTTKKDLKREEPTERFLETSTTPQNSDHDSLVEETGDKEDTLCHSNRILVPGVF